MIKQSEEQVDKEPFFNVVKNYATSPLAKLLAGSGLAYGAADWASKKFPNHVSPYAPAIAGLAPTVLQALSRTGFMKDVHRKGMGAFTPKQYWAEKGIPNTAGYIGNAVATANRRGVKLPGNNLRQGNFDDYQFTPKGDESGSYYNTLLGNNIRG